MKSINELNKDILFITMKIHREFPELSKYIGEMPIKYSNIISSETDAINSTDYYNSLVEMLNNYSKTHMKNKKTPLKKIVNFPGYPLYPPIDDIYQQEKEETDINPENILKNKSGNEEEGTMNEKSFAEDMSGDDLDIPGSELDDQQERIGSEDEENNYYSLGGDGHNNLEEDNG